MTVLSTPEAWKKCKNAEDGRASTVCDATKTCSLVPGSVQHLTRTPPARFRHSNATWNDSGKGFSVCAHWTHLKRRTSFLLHFQHSPSCWHNLKRSRIRSSFSFWTRLADRRLTLDNQLWLRQCWGACGRPSFGPVEWSTVAEFRATKFSMLSFFACLCFPAGEHSPFDSSLWTRPLRYRLDATLEFFHMLIFALAVVVFENALVRYSFIVAHHQFSAMSFYSQNLHLHGTTTSALESVQTTWAALVGSQHASTHCCLCLGLLTT